MQREKIKDKEEKKKSGMFEMMKKCCAGRAGFSDCSAEMEGMMEAIRKQHCCASNEDAAESERRKK